ncbi:type I-E CRISPR-associated protein Cas6/Cse3/CasE [Calidifontibacter sp. DB0510]|uniref:Type I-E CRISPR-associated protein Cas6/Cse3/CasE n=1 Tax=Metallococcus carri TaxID=1656884 RepID=A0A967EAT4_9MICO|nr:type I-E CRISPR-associated protein Cas6/Cse3/CasE [Metallococcus carri]NHN56239.1 type I-E CRISPR-associated protein Cas6/Cse3/CasE [Metallococcus carri]NOP38709.1 type I-E CRISPR-associated protein Cas6/Cse3/CasE [Calidifontibacter sp. DB2511S]
MDVVTHWPLDAAHLRLAANPDTLHKRVMRYLPDLGGRSSAIRADTDTQYRVDLPNDVCGDRGRITLRLRSHALEGFTASEGAPQLANGIRLTAVVAAEKRATQDDGRVRIRPVTDDEAEEWARELLRRHGFDTSTLAVSAARAFGSLKARRSVHFTVRDIVATVNIADPALAALAVERGIGRGRAYGLGMLVAMPSAAPVRAESAS